MVQRNRGPMVGQPKKFALSQTTSIGKPSTAWDVRGRLARVRLRHPCLSDWCPKLQTDHDHPAAGRTLGRTLIPHPATLRSAALALLRAVLLFLLLFPFHSPAEFFQLGALHGPK